jgi:hypothetical protein
MKKTTSIKIEPIKWQHNKPMVTQFICVISFDDRETGATFTNTLQDENGNTIDVVNVLCNGEDYQNWDGNNEFPATYSAQKLNFIIKENE